MPSCFNGAATLPLRKLVGLLGIYGGRIKLQWGRNFIVAEIDVIKMRAKMHNMLQWGRNFIVAEIPVQAKRYVQRHDASMGPQLYRCGNLNLEITGFDFEAMLQWGRNFIVAEMVYTPRRPT